MNGRAALAAFLRFALEAAAQFPQRVYRIELLGVASTARESAGATDAVRAGEDYVFASSLLGASGGAAPTLAPGM